MKSRICCNRLLSRLLPGALCLPLLFAQSSSVGYMGAGQPQRVAGKRNDAVETRIPCTVQAGYHVNSNTPTDEYLIPLKLTWVSTGALQPLEVAYPKPTMEKYQFAPKPLSVLTGKFDLVAKFKVAPNASAGPGQATGKLRYQACNDRACYPPRTIDIAVPYNIN